VAYLPADIDRLYGRANQPDHADLLAALVRWVAVDDATAGQAGRSAPVKVEGPGLIDVHAYVQGGRQPQSGSGSLEGAERVIVHLVNLTHANTWKAPVDELIRIGEQRVSLTAPVGRGATAARLLVAGTDAELHQSHGAVTVTVPGVTDHEVLVIELG
jgi:hypothetical protein